MFECKCGRKFKTIQELGGHVRATHPKGQESMSIGEDAAVSPSGGEPTPVPAEKAETTQPASEAPSATSTAEKAEATKQPASEASSPQPAPAAPSAEEPSEAEQIQRYLKEGRSFKQLRDVFHFKESTIKQEMAKLIPPDSSTAKTDGNEIPTLPMILKAGQGQEVISPEGILRYYFLSDGDPGAWMFKGMMLLRAAQLMNLTDVEIMKGQADAQAKAIKPILDVMEQARKDMDAAAARARESSVAIAEAAAMGAAGGVLGRIDARFEELRQKKTDIATVPDPMKGLMARTMETMMNRVMGMMVGGQVGGQVPPTPGLIDKRVQQQGG